MSFLEFMVNTYEEPFSRKHRSATKAGQVSNPTQDKVLEGPRQGRPQNTRSRYLDSHPRSETWGRVIRSKGHNTLPSIVGPYFPRQDDPDQRNYYCASMLALLVPWRNLRELKGPMESWEHAFLRFKDAATPRIIEILAGIQYYYDCASAAQKNREGTGINHTEDIDKEHTPLNDEGALYDASKVSDLPQTVENSCLNTV
jgi:hypothetical protein